MMKKSCNTNVGGPTLNVTHNMVPAWSYHDPIMLLSWYHHGPIMALSCSYHGTIMVIPCCCHGPNSLPG